MAERMRCWYCGAKMIWGGDHTFEDYGIEEEGIVANFSCSKCRATAEVRMPLGGE